MENPENDLTLYPGGSTVEIQVADMDSTVKKLLRKLEEIDLDMMRLKSDRESIVKALGFAGVTPPGPAANISREAEARYQGGKPFEAESLGNACLRVLRDHKGAWLTKAQIEYLVTNGGYPFTAKNPRSSVKITLRRLVIDGRCQVRSTPQGNTYGWAAKEDGEHNELKDSITTKTKAGER